MNNFSGERIIGATTIFESIIAFFAIILLIVFAAWLYRKMVLSNSMNNKQLSVISCLALGPRERIVIAKVYEKKYLIGVCGSGITMLTELTGKPCFEEGCKGEFSQYLDAAIQVDNGCANTNE